MRKTFIYLIMLMICLSMTIEAKDIKVENAFITYVYGSVKIKSGEAASWEKAKIKQKIGVGDTLKTGRRSKAEINISGKKIIKIKPNTEIEIPKVYENEGGLFQTIKLLFGYVHVNGKKVDGEFNIQTPKAICGIRGTRYTLQVAGPREVLTVLSGSVMYSTFNKKVSKLVKKGEKITVKKAEEIKVEKVNVVKEEKKVIKEFIQKETESIESQAEELIETGSIEEAVDSVTDNFDVNVDLTPTETSTVGETKPKGSLHINW
ncbi:MAG: hypothetical protein C0601_11060 [Candidatus Muiribacterium halophilum]|uniref:FecR protein domain-containing protein n=1 Tax=Muiribacterium halophilum TaxID=2053465 RepID=A0A2N5ZBW0_MUIH1|nr:MAG: hypothetical protein C0601_11060 [Candidatus Muirbacterium halophilum]